MTRLLYTRLTRWGKQKWIRAHESKFTDGKAIYFCRNALPLNGSATPMRGKVYSIDKQISTSQSEAICDGSATPMRGKVYSIDKQISTSQSEATW